MLKKILKREVEVRRIEDSQAKPIGDLSVATVKTAAFSIGKKVDAERESSGASGKNRVYQRRSILAPLMIDTFFAVHGHIV